VLRVAHRGRLGDFQFQPRRLDPGVGQQLVQPRQQFAPVALARRQVHRHPQAAHAVALPFAHQLDRARQHPVAQRQDQAGLLGDRDHPPGRDRAELGIGPAQQRFGADHAPAGERDLGLQVQVEALFVERDPDPVLHHQALVGGGVHGRRIELEVAAPLALGHVHRGVGVAHQHGGAGGVAREQRDPQRGAAVHGLASIW
jgi:hypothetical protein